MEEFKLALISCAVCFMAIMAFVIATTYSVYILYAIGGVAVLATIKFVVLPLHTIRTQTALPRAEAYKVRTEARLLKEQIRTVKMLREHSKPNLPGGSYFLPLEYQKQLQLPPVKIEEVLQIEAPTANTIPAVIRYEDIRREIPPSLSLLGIHLDGKLELIDWSKLKMLWLVGSSSTGKSNTIYGKALETVQHGAKLLVIDQHANKPDSLSRRLQSLSSSFLRPIAVSDSEVLSTLEFFKAEFQRRVDGAPCTQEIVLIVDEVNRMARNEDLIKAIKDLVFITGEESRGFGMYGWWCTQKCVNLKWLRDSAITVIAHRLTSLAEAKLACNDDLKAARKLLQFPVGRSYVYGVDFDEPLELQQPLYDLPPIVMEESDFHESSNQGITQQWEVNQEATGSNIQEKDADSELSVKILREIGKKLKAGEDKAKIIKSFGLPYGRATQEIGLVVDMVSEQLEGQE